MCEQMPFHDTMSRDLVNRKEMFAVKNRRSVVSKISYFEVTDIKV